MKNSFGKISWSGLLDFDMLPTISCLEAEIQVVIDMQDLSRQSPNDVFSNFLETRKNPDRPAHRPIESLVELESSAVPKSTHFQQCM